MRKNKNRILEWLVSIVYNICIYIFISFLSYLVREMNALEYLFKIVSIFEIDIQ